MKNIIKTAMLLIGGTVGAGFASGQEINIYFNKWGGTSYIALFISCLLLGIIIYIIMDYAREKNIHTYEEFLVKICKGNLIVARINKNLITVFLLASFHIMIIGFATVLEQEYEINKLFSIAGISFLSYFVLQGNIKRITNVNILIVPIIIVFILVIGTMAENPISIDEVITSSYSTKSILGAIIYTGYNFTLICPLIIVAQKLKLDRNQSKTVAIAVFLVLFILGIIILNLVSKYDVTEIEIPLLYITSFINENINIITSVLILFAIFTSIICVGYSFLNNITEKNKTKNTYKILSLGICVSSVMFVNIDFSIMMSWVYSFLGVLGIYQIFVIILAKFRNN